MQGKPLLDGLFRKHPCAFQGRNSEFRTDAQSTVLFLAHSKVDITPLPSIAQPNKSLQVRRSCENDTGGRSSDYVNVRHHNL